MLILLLIFTLSYASQEHDIANELARKARSFFQEKSIEKVQQLFMNPTKFGRLSVTNKEMLSLNPRYPVKIEVIEDSVSHNNESLVFEVEMYVLQCRRLLIHAQCDDNRTNYLVTEVEMLKEVNLTAACESYHYTIPDPPTTTKKPHSEEYLLGQSILDRFMASMKMSTFEELSKVYDKTVGFSNIVGDELKFYKETWERKIETDAEWKHRQMTSGGTFWTLKEFVEGNKKSQFKIKNPKFIEFCFDTYRPHGSYDYVENRRNAHVIIEHSIDMTGFLGFLTYETIIVRSDINALQYNGTYLVHYVTRVCERFTSSGDRCIKVPNMPEQLELMRDDQMHARSEAQLRPICYEY